MEIVSLANTTYANRYIFSGFRTQTPSLSSDGLYLGDDGAIFLQIDNNDYRQINIPARDLFEASEEEQEVGHTNMIDCVELLKTGLETNNIDYIHSAMSEVDFQLEKAMSYRAKLGALYNALDSATKRLELSENNAKDSLSIIEEVDMFKATSDFKRSEAVLQSTLQASNKMLQPSLLNFMN
jgi:flagellar hook-associated protein 3 FlgL